MIRCEMCDMEVPVGSNGRCFIGHPLNGFVPASESTAVPQPEADAFVPAPEAEVPVVPPPPAPTPPAPQPLAPQPLAPQPLAPQPLAPQPLAPQPLAPQPLAPQPLAPRPLVTPQPLGAGAPPAGQPQPLVPQPVASVAPPSAPQSPAPLVAPVFGSAALAVAPALETAPYTLTSQELFVVHAGGGRASSTRNPIKVAVAAIVAVVAAFGGYKAIGSVMGGEESSGAGGSRTVAGLPAAAGSLHRVFKPGEQHSYQMTAAIDGTMTSPEGGESEKVAATALVSFTEKVVSRDGSGVTTLRYTIDRARVQAAGQTMTLPIAGGGIDVRVGRNGKLLASDPFGKGVDSLPDEGFYELLMPVLKPGAKVGEGWTSKNTATMPGLDPMTVTTTYRLNKLASGQATVHSTSEAPFDLELSAEQLLGAFGGAGGAPGGGGSLHMAGRMIMTADQVVDVASGRTVSGKAKGTMNAVMSIEGREVMRMSMRITVTLSPETRIPPSAV